VKEVTPQDREILESNVLLTCTATRVLGLLSIGPRKERIDPSVCFLTTENSKHYKKEYYYTTVINVMSLPKFWNLVFSFKW